MKLILASSSPHRKKILEYLDFPFSILNPDIDETSIEADSPRELVANIARAKAMKALTLLDTAEPTILITADSLACTSEGEVLGKPNSEEDAFRILESILNSTHSLFTGYTIIKTSPYLEITATAETRVTMRQVPKEELTSYIKKRAWVGLAGGYGIQQEASSFIERIEGCFLNVVGLPLKEIITHLLSLGLPLSNEKAKFSCETINNITCCISQSPNN